MEYKLSDFNHKVDIQIRFNDIDGFRHVSNSVIFEYLDIGRLDYFQKALDMKFNIVDNESLVVVSTKTDYCRPAHLWDKLSVYSKVYKLGGKSLKMIQWIVRDGEEEPLTICDSVLSGFIPDKEQSMSIPDKWRNLLNEFEKGTLQTVYGCSLK